MSIFRQLDWERFIQEADTFDEAVLSTPGIDNFCSSSAWIRAAHHAFTPSAEPLILASSQGYVAMILEQAETLGRVLLPMEASWCLPSSLVGPEPSKLVRPLFRYLQEREHDWDAILFAGLLEGSPLFYYLPRVFASRYRIYRGPHVSRRIARIGDGVPAFLARRSTKLRKNLRQAEKKAAAAGVTFLHYHEPMDEARWSDLFARMMAVEANSWKGLSGNGVDQDPMKSFYHELIRLQAPKGGIRVVLAHLDGIDIGYILGGVLANFFRGYQFSYHTHYRHFSLGNLMQWHMIEMLVAEGLDFYDLGTDIPYKSRWGEIEFETASLIVRK